MVERIRVFRGSQELNLASGQINVSDDLVVDGGSISVEGDSSIIPGSVLDFTKADGLTNIFSAKVLDKKKDFLLELPVLTNGWELFNRRVERVLTGYSPEAIVEEVVNDFTDNLTFIPGVSSGVVVPKYVARSQYAADVISEMMTLLGWRLRINNLDEVYFEPKAVVNKGRVFRNGEDFEVKLWHDGDVRAVVNRVKVKCGNITNSTTETVTGTGTVFDLSHKPRGNMRVVVGGVEIAPDVNNTEYSVDVEGKQVVFTSSRTDPTFTYEFDQPVVVEDQDDDSIALYGEIFKEVSVPSITSFVDARRFAREFLSVYSVPRVSCEGVVASFDYDLDVNEEVRVVDDVRGMDELLIVVRKSYKLVEGLTSVVFGPRSLDYGDRQKEVEERIKKLERAIQDEDEVVFARTIKNNLRTDVLYDFRPYLMFPMNSFILDHVTLGRLRASEDFEADCSDNGYSGVWSGSGIGGDQYVMPTYSNTMAYYRLNAEDGANDMSYGGGNDGTYQIVTGGSGFYYPFRGNADDASTSGNDGTVNDATLTSDHLGAELSAYNFNGSSHWIDSITDNSVFTGANGFTIAAWIRPLGDHGGDNGRIVDKSTGTAYQNGFALLHNNINNRIYFRISGSGTQYNSLAVFPGVWTHVVLTVTQAGDAVIYGNGVNITNSVGTVTPTSNITTTNALRIGNRSAATDRSFNGDISEILVIPTVLSADEVLRLYNYTIVHKLDRPLITKTDVDGNSITGYEFITPHGTSLASSFSNYLISDSSLGLTQTGTWGVYLDMMIISSNDTNAQIWSAGDASSNRINLSISTTDLLGFQRYDGSSYTGRRGGFGSNIGKVKKVLCENNGGTLTLYIDGVSFGSSANNYSPSLPTGRLLIGYTGNTTSDSRGCNMIVSKPVVFDRVLSIDEREKLFVGKPVENLFLGGMGPRLSYAVFNGTDNFVEASGLPNTVFTGANGFSVAAWVRPTGTHGANFGRIADKSTNTSGASGFLFFHDNVNENLAFRVVATGSPFTSSVGSVPMNVWSHVVVNVTSAGTATIYVNGVEDTIAGASNSTSGITTANALRIGNRSTATDRAFNGEMDEVLIFDKVINTDTINDLMTNHFGEDHSDYASCKLWYSFDNPLLGDRFTPKLRIDEVESL